MVLAGATLVAHFPTCLGQSLEQYWDWYSWSLRDRVNHGIAPMVREWWREANIIALYGQ